MARRKIVYLLGAGASYYSIPTIDLITDELKVYIKYLKEHFPERKRELDDFMNLCGEITFYRTPDTLAKKNYLIDKDDFRVNKLLSTFLIFCQLEKSPQMISDYSHRYCDDNLQSLRFQRFYKQLDPRYLSFFATILKSDYRLLHNQRLPEHVSIVSWNYDCQVELSFQTFFKQPLCSAQEDLNTFPGLRLPSDLQLKSIRPNSNIFSLTKLNGTAGFKVEGEEALFDPIRHQTNYGTMKILVERLCESRDSGNLLHFAWEDDKYVQKARLIAKHKVNQADVLVIIGYSFPDFNREIDRQIFENASFSKIYLQDPNANDIVQKLDGVKEGLREITQIETQTNNFIIPREYWENI